MSRNVNRRTCRTALAVLFFLALPIVGRTSVIPNPGKFLDETEAVRTKNHALFVTRLNELRTGVSSLDQHERWHLRYLEAWEAMYNGNYVGSRIQFQDIIDHSNDPVLTAKSSARLLSSYGITRDYEKAFALANRLATELPKLKDAEAHAEVLYDLSQTFNLAGQSDLALKYAQMLVDTTPPGGSLCYPLTSKVFALSNAHKVQSDSAELKQAIQACIADDQPVVQNSLWLVQGEHLLAEGKPTKVLAMLGSIRKSLDQNKFQPHLLSALAQRAEAYEMLGRDNDAEQAALSAIKMSDPGDVSEWLRDVYQVLYRVAKRRGESSTALRYYQYYVEQDRGYLNDISARTLAFQLAKQQVLAKKLETEELSKQNAILKLQQQLDAKAVETSRLYIVLLLIGLTGIVLWLLRLKHSQLRFKRMATRDGLTGILNHQHFINESERQLRHLERKSGQASLLWMDLDHFKQINDTHGHAAGDAVLRHIVKVCNDHLRPGDLFGRLGGEEFGILLLECERDHAIAIADRIRLAIEGDPLEHEGMMLSVSASVGVASTCNAGHALQRLCRRADAALYRAKRDGRNRVVADAGEGTSVFA